MFDEFSQCTFLLFVFQGWDRCFQLIGSLVDLLHFIFEIPDMSIPRIFGHCPPLPAAYRHTPYHATGTRGAHMQPRVSGERYRTRRSSDRAVEFVGVLTTRSVASKR